MIFKYGFSIQGLNHESSDLPCQDAHSILELHNNWVVAAIADGLGSAARSDISANIAVNTVTDIVSKYIPKMWHTKTLMSVLHTSFVAAQNNINAEMEKQNHLPEEYDTTLTAVIYNGRNIVYGHVGDGGIIGLGSFGDYFKITEVQKGEEHNMVIPLRGGPEYWVFDYSEEEFSSILLLTDGLLDIILPPILQGNIYINYVRQFMDIKKLGLTEINKEQVINKIETILKSDKLDFVTDDKTMVGLVNCDLVPQDKEHSYYEEPNWEKLKEKQRKALYGNDEKLIKNADPAHDIDDNAEVETLDEKALIHEQNENDKSSEDVDKGNINVIGQSKKSKIVEDIVKNKASEKKATSKKYTAIERNRHSIVNVKKVKDSVKKLLNKE